MKKILKLIVIVFSICLTCCSSLRYTTIEKPPNRPNDKEDVVVFFVAHQDDDVFIASKIIEHLKSNDKVFVVYSCLSYQRGDKYKNKRISEAYKALNSIGIDKSNIMFLGFPDMESHKHLKELIYKTDSIFHRIKPDYIYTSAYEGGNIDHDVANYVIKYIQDNSKNKFIGYEFPEYSGYDTKLVFKLRSFPNEPPTFIEEISKSEYKSIVSYWNNYKSQKISFGLYMSLTSGKKVAFGYEYYRPLGDYNYIEKPPTLSIAYEKYLKATFNEFVKEVRKIEETPAANILYK